MPVDFRILRQLEAVDNGEPVALGSPQQRALFARLLISANEVVATDRLIEDLGRGKPPDTARHTLHVYISWLRKVIDAEYIRLVKPLVVRVVRDSITADHRRLKRRLENADEED